MGFQFPHFVCLLSAALIGWLVGWLLGRFNRSRPSESLDEELAGKMRLLEEERDRLQVENADLKTKINSFLQAQHRPDEAQSPLVRDAHSTPAGTIRRKHSPRQRARRKPRKFQHDDLKLIVGIGPVLERRLNRLGIVRFKQIAEWTSTDIDHFARELNSFGDRITREDWVSGAKKLHKEKYGETM